MSAFPLRPEMNWVLQIWFHLNDLIKIWLMSGKANMLEYHFCLIQEMRFCVTRQIDLQFDNKAVKASEHLPQWHFLCNTKCVPTVTPKMYLNSIMFHAHAGLVKTLIAVDLNDILHNSIIYFFFAAFGHCILIC